MQKLIMVLICVPNAKKGWHFGTEGGGVPEVEVWIVQDADEAEVDIHINEEGHG